MSVLAQLEPRAPQGNRRYAPRRALRLGSFIHGSGADAVVHDLSVTGLLLEASADLVTGERLIVELPEYGPALATVVWTSSRFFGCEFQEPIPAAAISAALLRTPQIGSSSAIEETAPGSSVEHSIDADMASGKFSLRVRLIIVVGLGLLAWALIAMLLVWF